jgi:hypothetical protein
VDALILASVPLLWIIVVAETILMIGMLRLIVVTRSSTTAGHPRSSGHQLLGSKVPSTRIAQLGGGALNLRELCEPRGLVVVTAKAGCGNCRDLLRDIERQTPPLPWCVLVAATDQVAGYLVDDAGLSPTVPVGLLTAAQLEQMFPARRAPTAFLVDDLGVIRRALESPSAGEVTESARLMRSNPMSVI